MIFSEYANTFICEVFVLMKPCEVYPYKKVATFASFFVYTHQSRFPPKKLYYIVAYCPGGSQFLPLLGRG